MRMCAKRFLTAVTFVTGVGVIAGGDYALAEAQLPGEPTLRSSDASTFGMMVKVVLFLIVIIGIFLLIMKVISQKNKMFQSGRSIKSIGGLGLGQNKSVQLVQIGRSLYILGVGNDVELVSKIDDPDEIQYIIEHLHSGSGDFKGLQSLGGWMKKLTKQQEHPEDLDMTPSFQAVFHEKMQRLANRQKKVDEMMGYDLEEQNARLKDKP
jgi:flagellar protein FliO/FliZ